MHIRLLSASILLFAIYSPKLVLSENKICDKEIATTLARQCENPKLVKNLNDFLEFYYNFEHLNSQCLQLNSVTKKPEQYSLEAETKCQMNGFYYQQVRPFARLVAHWMSGEPVCTIEYTVKLYHFHNQLRQSSDKFQMHEKLLRLLANSVAAKCRLTLASRLRQVERRALDSVKHINLIVGLTSFGSDRLGRLKPLDPIEQYVPILERELPEKIYGPYISSLGRDGFEFKLSSGVRVSYDSVRMSCQAMKLYHVNLLGSLGLLASLGYASPIELGSASSNEGSTRLGYQLIIERQSDTQIVKRWLMSALLCQTLRNTLKMASVNAEGRQVSRLKVVETQEADVSVDDEQDTKFSTFRLSESGEDEDEDEVRNWAWKLIANPDDRFANFTLDLQRLSEMNSRKLHLLTGPNYKLSSALFTYFDLSQSDLTKRFEAIRELLGVPLVLEQPEDGEEEEED